jgi:hypothetical protein
MRGRMRGGPEARPGRFGYMGPNCYGLTFPRFHGNPEAWTKMVRQKGGSRGYTAQVPPDFRERTICTPVEKANTGGLKTPVEKVSTPTSRVLARSCPQARLSGRQRNRSDGRRSAHRHPGVDRDPAEVLVEAASKRSVCRDYGLAHKTLQKILANTEPPGYRSNQPDMAPAVSLLTGHG